MPSITYPFDENYQKHEAETDAQWFSRIHDQFKRLNPEHLRPDLLLDFSDIGVQLVPAWNGDQYTELWHPGADYNYGATSHKPVPPYSLYDHDGCAICWRETDTLPDVPQFYATLHQAVQKASLLTGHYQLILIHNAFDKAI